MRLEETSEWVRGELCVDILRRRAAAKGLPVFRMDLSTSGRSPCVELPDGRRRPMGDLLVGSDIVEAKWKSYAPATRNNSLGRQCRRHGIDLPLWESYNEIASAHGLRFYICIVQLRPDRLAMPAPMYGGATLEKLADSIVQRRPEPLQNFPQGAVFWDVETFKFRELELTEEEVQRVQALPPARLRDALPWERRGRDGKSPAERDAR